MDLERLKIDRQPTAKAPATRRRRRGGLGWLVLLLILAGAGWLFRRPILEKVDRLRLPTVTVVRVARASRLAANAVSGTTANGYVVARHRAALSADTPGRIVELNVEEGSVVKKGEVVARLFAEEYEADLRRAQAELQAANAAVGRAAADVGAAELRLAELRSRVASSRASLAEAEAGVRLAELELGRAQELAKEDFATQQDVDNAEVGLEQARARESAAAANLAEAEAALLTGESNVSVAKASLLETEARVAVAAAARDQAQATLSKTAVRAPFDGVVVLKDAEVGEVVSPNSQGAQSRGSVATMVDFESLEVQVELPETSLSAVELDAPANVYLDAFPQRLYRGRVRTIWPTANRQKATVEVRVVFEETDERLRPEMGARVVFSPGEEPAELQTEEEGPPPILIPSASLVRVEGRPGVFVLERDVARFRSVETGGERSGRIVVEAGLEEGERILSNPPTSLKDGERVRVQEG